MAELNEPRFTHRPQLKTQSKRPRPEILTHIYGSPFDPNELPMGGGGFEQIDAPIWFTEMLQKRTPLPEILQALRDRVMSGKVDLHMAKSLVNTAGRAPHGMEAIKKLLTQELVSGIKKRGR